MHSDQGDEPDVLINDHPAGSNMNADSESEGVSSSELDLAALNDVVYEDQEGEPGVKYTSESGEASCTPVVNPGEVGKGRLNLPRF